MHRYNESSYSKFKSIATVTKSFDGFKDYISNGRNWNIELDKLLNLIDKEDFLTNLTDIEITNVRNILKKMKNSTNVSNNEIMKTITLLYNHF